MSLTHMGLKFFMKTKEDCDIFSKLITKIIIFDDYQK